MVRTGDVVTNGPGAWHWHGGTPTTAMAHVSGDLSGVVGRQVVFLVKVWRGRNWARITLTVFAGFGVVGTLLGLISPRWALSYVSAPVTVALYVGAVVLLYRPAATAYFTGHGRG